MRVISAYIFLFFLLTALYSCSKGKLDGDDYANYIENKNNPLNKEKQIGDLSFQLQYCPLEYLLMKEFKTTHLSHKIIDQRKKENDSLLYFRLRIKGKDQNGDVINYKISSNEDYYTRLDYLSYGFEENLALANGKDTVFPAIFHFERTYGIAPYADFMMAFKTNPVKDKDMDLLIDDNVFGNGLVKFSYSGKDIENIPTLKTD